MLKSTTPTPTKYDFAASLLTGNLLNVVVSRAGGSDRTYFGQFNGFNEHINKGISLKNVLCLAGGKTYTQVNVGDVEIRNLFSHRDYVHTIELQDNSSVIFKTVATTTIDHTAVMEEVGRITITILNPAK